MNRLSDVGLIETAVIIALVPLFRYQPDPKEKTGEETEMEPKAEESPLDSVPEAGNSNVLKSLWFPTSTISTQKSGQIIYGCAFLLGEQWDFFFCILKLTGWGGILCLGS